MNELVTKFGDKLVILAFPCNQFGRQEWAKADEILNVLRYVRPGNDFIPKFPIMEKCDVNGKDEHYVFKFLKEHLPNPSDQPLTFDTKLQHIFWEPLSRSDIAWNFEKFLIAPDGKPFKRYSRYFHAINIEDDIKQLIERHNI